MKAKHDADSIDDMARALEEIAHGLRRQSDKLRRADLKIWVNYESFRSLAVSQAANWLSTLERTVREVQSGTARNQNDTQKKVTI